jgi:hypothetical protein
LIVDQVNDGFDDVQPVVPKVTAVQEQVPGVLQRYQRRTGRLQALGRRRGSGTGRA